MANSFNVFSQQQVPFAFLGTRAQNDGKEWPKIDAGSGGKNIKGFLALLPLCLEGETTLDGGNRQSEEFL